MRSLPALFCLAVLTGSVIAESDYKFSLEGREITADVLPVLGARKGSLAPGDVGKAGEFFFLLEQPGHYQFRIDGKGDSLLYCKIDAGAERCLGARQITLEADGKQSLHDPLADLSTAQKKTLRTVHLEEAAETDWIEGSTTFLSLRRTATRELPNLPPDLRYLHLRCDAPLTESDLGKLKPLADLLFLTIELPADAGFSLGAIRGCTDLRNLDIKGGRLTEVDSLATLASLRFVKLRDLDGLDSVAWARALPELRVLKVDGTAVDDLRPLAISRNLRLLSANGTKVAHLPELSEIPAIRDIRLHSTPLAKNKKYLAPYRRKTGVLVKNWDPSIKGFEAHDKKNPPPEKPVLFIGSSSIRMWDLKKSFPKHSTMNRGFGGSELSDALRYFDRIVLPYRPKAILLYAGDNDIANGETAEQVVADYQSFARKVRSKLPDAQFAYIPIKPSLARLGMWDEMKKANAAILELTKADPKLHYLDTATPLIGNDPQPKWEYFLNDGLHLNEEGYRAWNAIVGPWLDSL